MTVRQDVVFFYPESAFSLASESREMEIPEISTFAIQALTAELLRGMNERWPGQFVPEDAGVRAAYLIDRTAVIDIEAPSLTEGWTTGSQTEILAVQSLVHSIVANFEGVESVQILINGGEVPTFAGHVDLSKPLRPDPSLSR